MDLGEIQEVKSYYKSSTADKKLLENMRSLFINVIFYQDPDTQIACITFILSFFINMDLELKTQFLINF